MREAYEARARRATRTFALLPAPRWPTSKNSEHQKNIDWIIEQNQWVCPSCKKRTKKVRIESRRRAGQAILTIKG
jgi:hypothetical protein